MSFHKHIQIAGTVTVGPKGQVVIPSEVREQMGIIPGSKLVALYAPDKKTICFITEAQAQEFVDMMGSEYTHLRDKVQQATTQPPKGADE